MSLGTMEQRTEGMKCQAAELIEQEYSRGFKAGWEDRKEWDKDQADILIEKGMNMAWDAARKLVASYSTKEIMPFFGLTHGTGTWHKMITEFSPTEAIKRIREYEEKQKQKEDEEIHVWDEVQSLGEITGIVTYISETEGFNILWKDGSVGKRKNISDYKKTGRTFPQISELLKKLQEDE